MASKIDDTTTTYNLINTFKFLSSNFDYVLPGLDSVTGVETKDVIIDPATNVGARLYLPQSAKAPNKKVPVLVYYHGGGFLLNDKAATTPNQVDFINAIAFQAGVLVVAVKYRVAWEAKLPAAWEDSMVGLKWVFTPNADPWLTEHGDFSHVFIAGDSAGANIVHNMAMQLEANGLPQVEGVALLCPYFGGSKLVGGETECFHCFLTFAWGLVMSPGMSFDDPRINPEADGAPSLAGLGCRKAMVVTAGEDLLRWRGYAYRDGLGGSGWAGKLDFKEYEGVGHDFFISDLESKQSKELMASLVAFFNSRDE